MLYAPVMIKALTKAFNEACKNEAFRNKMKEISSKMPADKGVDEYASHLNHESRDKVDDFLPSEIVNIKHSVTDKVNEYRASKEPKADKMAASFANGGRFVADSGSRVKMAEEKFRDVVASNGMENAAARQISFEA